MAFAYICDFVRVITVKGNNHHSCGISFKTVTSEHSKESMKLISHVVFHNT